jgi:hypothetical protein
VIAPSAINIDNNNNNNNNNNNDNNNNNNNNEILGKRNMYLLKMILNLDWRGSIIIMKVAQEFRVVDANKYK